VAAAFRRTGGGEAKQGKERGQRREGGAVPFEAREDDAEETKTWRRRRSSRGAEPKQRLVSLPAVTGSEAQGGGGADGSAEGARRGQDVSPRRPAASHKALAGQTRARREPGEGTALAAGRPCETRRWMRNDSTAL